MNHLRLLVSIGTVDFASTDIDPKSEKDKHPSQPILTTISFTPKLLIASKTLMGSTTRWAYPSHN